MSQTYTVQLAADISDLQAELARIPGFTEKSASAAALKGALQLQKMGGAAKDVKRETGEVGDGLLPSMRPGQSREVQLPHSQGVWRRPDCN